jgi:predicted component of type VI protein secretion system
MPEPAEPLSLEIIEGADVGRLYALAGPLELGRDPSVGLRLDDAYVSPRHARITPDEDGALLQDLGDPGGTFVNDAEVFTSTRIKPGDQIQVGVTVLQLRRAGDVVSGPSAARPKPAALAAAQSFTAMLPKLMAGDAGHSVDSLLDASTKTKARHAPLAVLVIVIYAVLIYLATAKF